MNVLVDTSVWIEHFRRNSTQLAALLDADAVLCHPMVLLELACGTPPRRRQTLALLALLRVATVATTEEILGWLERERLYGLGCGPVDLSLLASVCVTPDARLWTLDKRLHALAQRMGVAYAARLAH